jgi:hypothetical protein
MKQVSVKEAVPWDGPATITLLCKHGQLLYDPDLHAVLAKCETQARDPMMIPIENIKFMVEYGAVAQKADEDKRAEAAQQAKAADERRRARERAADPDAPKGVDKFVKNAQTGAVELKKV